MGHEDQGIVGGGRRYQIVPRVLIFLQHNRDVLLLKGAPDKRIWANFFNGVGGHVEHDEDVLSAARREIVEETGLEPPELGLRAVVNVDAGDPDLGIMLYVFVGQSESRQVVNSNEGELHWIEIDTLDQYPLVEDLYWLLPRVLGKASGVEPLYLHYSYDDDDQLIIRPARRDT